MKLKFLCLLALAGNAFASQDLVSSDDWHVYSDAGSIPTAISYDDLDEMENAEKAHDAADEEESIEVTSLCEGQKKNSF